MILPGAWRYDGSYQFTEAAMRAFIDGELFYLELSESQAEAFIQIVSEGPEKPKLPEAWKAPHAWRDPKQWAPGHRNDMLFYWGVRLWGKKTDLRAQADIAALARMARESGLDPGEVEKTLDSAGETWEKRHEGLECENLFIKHAELIDREGRYTGEDGKIMRHVLESIMGLRIRRNSREARLEGQYIGFEGATPEEDLTAWEPVDDFLEARLKHLLRDKVRIAYDPPRVVDGEEVEIYKRYKSLSFIDTYIKSFYGRPEVDPFKLWLESLPAWNGENRLDGTLGACFDISANKYPEFAEWCFKSVLLGAVARCYHPGAKHDTVTVLVGPQGIGKSTFWRHLLPVDRWFSNNIELGGSVQRRVESILGCVLVECSEMRASRRADLEDIKNFITSEKDKVRLAYDRNVTELPRGFVIVASTNSNTSLPSDPTGNRRFLPVEVKRKGEVMAGDIQKYLEENRAQLWAEAVARVGAGEIAYLKGRKQERIQAEVNEAHTPRDEILENYLARMEKRLRDSFNDGEHQNGWTMLSIQDELSRFSGVDISGISPRTIGEYLTVQGWRKKNRMIDGVRQYLWTPPIKI